MTLPPSEIDRIAADANSKWPLDKNDPPNQYTSSRNALMLDFRSAYVSGAQAEALRGREQMVGFMEWLGRNYRESTRYKSIDGGKLYNLRKGTLEATWKDHRIEELIDTYILDTQKRKG